MDCVLVAQIEDDLFSIYYLILCLSIEAFGFLVPHFIFSIEVIGLLIETKFNYY